MARTSNHIPAEPLIPIDAIVGRFGYPGEVVWRRLDKKDVFEDWNRKPCVSWSRARQLYDEFTAAQEANDRENAERRRREEEALERERAELARAAAERERARPTRFGGVKVSVPPGEDGWARTE
jgi:hypothetical protein